MAAKELREFTLEEIAQVRRVISLGKIISADNHRGTVAQ
jgi:hypothetical protein